MQLYDAPNCDYEPPKNFQQNFGNPYDCPEGFYNGSLMSSVGYSQVQYRGTVQGYSQVQYKVLVLYWEDWECIKCILLLKYKVCKRVLGIHEVLREMKVYGLNSVLNTWSV